MVQTTDQVAPLRPAPSWAADFPRSQARPSLLFGFPGPTPASTAAVRRVLEENDRGYDMWEGQRRYAHNHFAHAALARYALGAPPDLLQATWEHDRQYLTSIDPLDDGRDEAAKTLPDKITAENWADPRWLGNSNSYSRYLPFFHAETQRLGMKAALQKYIFDAEANVGPPDKGPSMLNALFAGVVHPIIHIGYGLEFDDPMVFAEGLAQTCLHPVDYNAKLYPVGWPQTPLPTASGPPKPLIQLYHEFLSLPSFKLPPFAVNKALRAVVLETLTPACIAEIQDLVARWDLADMSDDGVKARFEEIAWLTTLITGATSRPGHEIRVDFFVMHTLTSAIFVPSYMPYLAAKDRRALLQSFALAVFQVLTARGRPHIFPAEVMSYPDQPTGGGRLAKEGALEALGDPSRAEEQNPWMEIVGHALAHRDAHVPKTIRSLLYFSTLYGHKPAGSVPGALNPDGSEAVPGLKEVDGSVFVRVAGKVMEAQGWVKEGVPDNEWDRSALGFDKAWELPKETARFGV